MLSPDYQQFNLKLGAVTDFGPRMQKKLQAITLPDVRNKRVLDVGCDHGFWSFWCAQNGAARIRGIDRGRVILGEWVNTVETCNQNAAIYFPDRDIEFADYNVGQQWPEINGKFDLVLLMSCYHHIYAQARQHAPIWYWLRRHMNQGAELIFEGPVDLADPVAANCMDQALKSDYHWTAISAAASQYFTLEKRGPALHEPNRHVLHFTAKNIDRKTYEGIAVDGAGGARPAFLYLEGRRAKQIYQAVDFLPYPGSLNVKLTEAFHWNDRYYRAYIMDVKDRKLGTLDQIWEAIPCRFYPLQLRGFNSTVFAMRFEKDIHRYPPNFLELIAPARLRDTLNGNEALVVCSQ